ncbi:hypothetical protein ACROYT_G015110 [Oculina patagonica]
MHDSDTVDGKISDESSSEEDEDGSVGFKCGTCGKVYNSKGWLIRHQSSCTAVKVKKKSTKNPEMSKSQMRARQVLSNLGFEDFFDDKTFQDNYVNFAGFGKSAVPHCKALGAVSSARFASSLGALGNYGKRKDSELKRLCKAATCWWWSLRKELERSRRYIRENMFSQSSETRQSVNAAYAKCELLEEHIIVQYSCFKENTNVQGTLEVTEDRHYRERGLILFQMRPFLASRSLKN